MCFMDASGNMDRHHCRVFLLLTHSCAGGLPLGIIITQSEEEQVILEGLELLKSLLDEESFSGRGESGPMIFLTDDSRAERAALSRAFPQAKLFLCSFHLLQAVWRWLWCKENDISMSDRTTLFAVVKDLLYAREESSLHSCYHRALESSAFNRYPKFKAYVEKLYSRRECWALCYRDTMPIRSNNTNNYSEAAMRILKDKILHRTKAYNVLQLFDFLTTCLSAYYEARITDAAIGHWEGLQKSRFLVKSNSVEPEDIHKIDASHFEVKSCSTPGKIYVVDVHLEMCTCPMGSSGEPCKHQAAVVLQHRVPSTNFLPQTAEMRAKLLYIATGKDNVPLQFLQPFREEAGPSTGTYAVPDLDIADDAWQEETDRVMVTEQVQQAGSEEASHQAAAAGFAEMCQELSALINSDSSFTASAVAAVKAFKKIKDNPSKIITALHMFADTT
ncbi:uncharacterized protein LOC130118399 [Lampris incognitus]|uniref:uncharacterized protein LOC130118399 n=1 Tax=Lampris incognitus TaxID=2546036 RepID=UPI0024B49BEE|nr:uncharacterized protein LOC130118399 [Lampris incognitus]XP_056142816.1 uncharacterized protein LOC130118399 [Lampris incognitus]